MKKNENVVEDCKCDQFYQVKVCRERDEDCSVSRWLQKEDDDEDKSRTATSREFQVPQTAKLRDP